MRAARITDLQGSVNARPPAPRERVMLPAALKANGMNADCLDEGSSPLSLSPIGLKGKRTKKNPLLQPKLT